MDGSGWPPPADFFWGHPKVGFLPLFSGGGKEWVPTPLGWVPRVLKRILCRPVADPAGAAGTAAPLRAPIRVPPELRPRPPGHLHREGHRDRSRVREPMTIPLTHMFLPQPSAATERRALLTPISHPSVWGKLHETLFPNNVPPPVLYYPPGEAVTPGKLSGGMVGVLSDPSCHPEVVRGPCPTKVVR